MRTTPLGSFLVTGRMGVQMSEKDGRSVFDHFLTFEYASSTSERAAPISRLVVCSQLVRDWYHSRKYNSQSTFQRRTTEIRCKGFFKTLFVVLYEIAQLQELVFTKRN
jgi:hypothetical protein